MVLLIRERGRVNWEGEERRVNLKLSIGNTERVKYDRRGRDEMKKKKSKQDMEPSASRNEEQRCSDRQRSDTHEEKTRPSLYLRASAPLKRHRVHVERKTTERGESERGRVIEFESREAECLVKEYEKRERNDGEHH